MSNFFDISNISDLKESEVCFISKAQTIPHILYILGKYALNINIIN